MSRWSRWSCRRGSHRGLVARPARAGVLAFALASAIGTTLAIAPTQAQDAPPADGAPGRLFVLMINGGGTRAENFQSHLDHLRELTAHFGAAGLPNERIAILAGDGDDPAPDLATRREQPADAWMLEGTELEKELAEPIRYVSSSVPGMTLRPATRRELARYLREARTRMTGNDTLLIYVTDHGQQDRRDHLRNRITLWGDDINVRQLASDLSTLPRGLRVVTVMSQCFSGGFAELPGVIPRSQRAGEAWRGPVCGYFASTPDRPAYGCYPESASDNRTGHAFTFIDALAHHTRLPEVHADVLLRDQTPDVPLRSSDLFLRDQLDRIARARGTTPEALGDQLLASARAQKAGVPELALAERLARVYDAPTALTLTEADRQLDALAAARETVRKDQQLWDSALMDQTRAQLEVFLTQHPDWAPRLRPAVLRKLDDDGRRALARELLAALETFASGDARLHTLLTDLLDRSNRAAELGYRLEVREAAFLRLRILLTSAAARLQLQVDPTRAPDIGRARAELSALEACEGLALPTTRQGAAAAAPNLPPLPTRAADASEAETLRPTWLGIAFRAAPAPVRRRFALTPGAAQVTSVVPRSPAATAGLAVGDIVVGPPALPFQRPGQIRAFTMLAKREPVTLEVLRQGGSKPEAVQIPLSPLPR